MEKKIDPFTVWNIEKVTPSHKYFSFYFIKVAGTLTGIILMGVGVLFTIYTGKEINSNLKLIIQIITFISGFYCLFFGIFGINYIIKENKKLGNKLYEKEEFKAALNCFELFLKFYPQDSESKIFKEKCLMSLNKFKDKNTKINVDINRMPEEFTVKNEGNLSIEYKWGGKRKDWIYLILTICLFIPLIACIILMFTGSQEKTSISIEAEIALFTIYFLMVLFSFYGFLVRVFNRTVITLDEKSITVRHIPFFWPGNKEITAGEIEAFTNEEYTDFTQGENKWEQIRFKVNAILLNKNTVTILSNLKTQKEALFLEEVLRNFLKI